MFLAKRGGVVSGGSRLPGGIHDVRTAEPDMRTTETASRHQSGKERRFDKMKTLPPRHSFFRHFIDLAHANRINPLPSNFWNGMTENKGRSIFIYPLLIATTFVLSRLLFYISGVRFDASGLDWYWQYLDVELLKTDLLRSVFYQHSQPPLFNLFLGLVLKLFPDSYASVFALTYKGFSLILYYTLFRVLRRLRLKPWIAYLAATLFMLTPTVVLYENWLFYTWPVAVLLMSAAYQLLLYEQTRRTKFALLYIASITVACLTRSMFHPVYFILAVIPILLLDSRPRVKISIVSGIALILIGSIFLKNFLLFGFFGSSSWMGMNLWKIAPIGEKSEQLADSGVTRLEPFSAIGDYPEAYRSVPESYAAVPAVAAELKQNGKPNLNHYGYLAVSKAYGSESIELIKRDPGGYLGIVLKAWGLYISPASDYPLLKPANINALGKYSKLAAPNASLFLIPAGLILTLLFFLICIVPRSRGGPRVQEWAFSTFCVGTVFYVAILGNFMEHGENMRFRVQTDPLLYVAALFALLHFSRFLYDLCSEKPHLSFFFRPGQKGR
jgi:hypothetical protein